MSRSRIEGIKREMYRKGILDSAESVPLDSGRRYNQDFESHPFYSICKNKEEKNTMFDNIKVKKQDSMKIKEKTDDGSLENIYHKIRDLKKDFQIVEKKLRSACEGLVNKNEGKYYPGRFTDHINSKQQNQPMISPPPLYKNTDHIISKPTHQPMISPPPLYTNTEHIISKPTHQPMISPPPLYTNREHIISKPTHQPMISPPPLYTNTDNFNSKPTNQLNKQMNCSLYDIDQDSDRSSACSNNSCRSDVSSPVYPFLSQNSESGRSSPSQSTNSQYLENRNPKPKPSLSQIIQVQIQRRGTPHTKPCSSDLCPDIPISKSSRPLSPTVHVPIQSQVIPHSKPALLASRPDNSIKKSSRPLSPTVYNVPLKGKVASHSKPGSLASCPDNPIKKSSRPLSPTVHVPIQSQVTPHSNPASLASRPDNSIKKSSRPLSPTVHVPIQSQVSPHSKPASLSSRPDNPISKSSRPLSPTVYNVPLKGQVASHSKPGSLASCPDISIKKSSTVYNVPIQSQGTTHSNPSLVYFPDKSDSSKPFSTSTVHVPIQMQDISDPSSIVSCSEKLIYNPSRPLCVCSNPNSKSSSLVSCSETPIKQSSRHWSPTQNVSIKAGDSNLSSLKPSKPKQDSLSLPTLLNQGSSTKSTPPILQISSVTSQVKSPISLVNSDQIKTDIIKPQNKLNPQIKSETANSASFIDSRRLKIKDQFDSNLKNESKNIPFNILDPTVKKMEDNRTELFNSSGSTLEHMNPSHPQTHSRDIHQNLNNLNYRDVVVRGLPSSILCRGVIEEDLVSRTEVRGWKFSWDRNASLNLGSKVEKHYQKEELEYTACLFQYFHVK
ncbi:uncharacterized protein LOC111700208 isoform X3 [Eurytemora carolleeae]|uniref:uncharacterized protein LOC111700208 isoform X3 n=1 Tax=Eurytemora carolleeae TaxID=1294199 RepID=UPI000C7896F5|nr:uncharacterized protein LOC111700208 isoform X3 [Eurytemora carolleeae]|eukprot:XP_023326839.1 uncharacterized protein LOC111700208 isoform X3 [Eurytemora affinis]